MLMEKQNIINKLNKLKYKNMIALLIFLFKFTVNYEYWKRLKLKLIKNIYLSIHRLA